jgi:hypothetical protein
MQITLGWYLVWQAELGLSTLYKDIYKRNSCSERTIRSDCVYLITVLNDADFQLRNHSSTKVIMPYASFETLSRFDELAKE